MQTISTSLKFVILFRDFVKKTWNVRQTFLATLCNLPGTIELLSFSINLYRRENAGLLLQDALG